MQGGCGVELVELERDHHHESERPVALRQHEAHRRSHDAELEVEVDSAGEEDIVGVGGASRASTGLADSV